MSKKPLRGINHVGVTVPDIEIATQFLLNGLGAHVIYESYSNRQREVQISTGT